jgi:hypothetical protein
MLSLLCRLFFSFHGTFAVPFRNKEKGEGRREEGTGLRRKTEATSPGLGVAV